MRHQKFFKLDFLLLNEISTVVVDQICNTVIPWYVISVHIFDRKTWSNGFESNSQKALIADSICIENFEEIGWIVEFESLIFSDI